MTDVVATPVSELPLSTSSNPDLRWYVVHAYSGMEKAVERNIMEGVNRTGMQSKFGRILVPTEEVVEMRSGQKRKSERKFFPGYVLVQMELDDDTWHLVKDTPKVTGFIGEKNKPAPIPDEVSACRAARASEAAARRSATRVRSSSRSAMSQALDGLGSIIDVQSKTQMMKHRRIALPLLPDPADQSPTEAKGVGVAWQSCPVRCVPGSTGPSLDETMG